MELRVESADGCSLPSSCFVGVRIGDTLKQGRYEPQRCYHFPQVDRRRNAKIDLYQHVGTCTVPVDPDGKLNHDVTVTSTNPSLPSLRLKISVQSQSDDSTKRQRETRMKKLKNQANEYLAKHNVEERLSEAVKALLKEQPDSPVDFICRVLRGDGPAQAAVPPASPRQQQPNKQPEASNQPEAPPPAAASDVASLRLQASEALMKASEDGELQRVLADIKKDMEPQQVTNSLDPADNSGKLQQVPHDTSTEAQAPAAAPRPAPAQPLAAPVKLDTMKPAMMMSTVSVCGPAFPSMGLRPTMLFI